MRRTTTGVLVAAALVLTVAACDGAPPADGPTQQPATGDPTGTASPSATPDAAPAGVTVEREYFGVDVDVTVQPVEVRDGVAALSVEVQADPAADVEGAPGLSIVLKGTEAANASAVRLVDGDQVDPVATVDGKPAAAFDGMFLEPGAPVTAVSLHQAPAGDTVGVLIPALGYVADVPVVEGGALFDSVAGRVGTPTETAEYPLRTFSAGADTMASQEKDTVTVTLRSDVLFASSEHKLSGKAATAIEHAATQITDAAAGGKVTVVGHTDDVDSDAFNQKLSEQRAKSVADKLDAELGDSYTIAAEGRGESEPVAEGTSDAARKANRRVEIVFEGELPVEDETGAGEELAPTDDPTASGLDPVTYTSPTTQQKYTAQVVDVTRTPAGLVGTVRLTADAANQVPVDALGDSINGLAADRGFGLGNRALGTHELSLLVPGKHVMPFDYEVPEGTSLLAGRRLLGDEALGFPIPEGAGLLTTAVWPDTGEDAVTVDVPGWFRITDVPVTEAN